MKYMLLMQFSAKTADFAPLTEWTQDEVRAHIAFMRDTNSKLSDAGELVTAEGLAGPEQARIVRAGGDGSAVVTEGPFPETKEFLAGYWIVDCESDERAVELAAYVSTAPGPGGKPLNMPIEVRQVMAGPPEEM
ncbi:YciI family protein [Streptomyces sp. 35G-GA-8]|uniref:YciI family protein n=1 Tax=Streptomyces sp. 35G-GA-8 TaxID=2939434 RepID=UPI00201FB0F1|nr:YciI family protein [Streptomyces sp. 35G-GA-8]MCL7378371.1 YciI family protein [Streptomyces sp. 35G-GA-8]